MDRHARQLVECILRGKTSWIFISQIDAARNDDTNVLQRYESVSAWIALGINFFSECIFIDEAGFNRNMHRSQGWSGVGSPCKITTETKGPNISILGAITAHGGITLSRREACAPTNKKRKVNDPASKKGTTSNDFMEFIEQVLYPTHIIHKDNYLSF